MPLLRSTPFPWSTTGTTNAIPMLSPASRWWNSALMASAKSNFMPRQRNCCLSCSSLYSYLMMWAGVSTTSASPLQSLPCLFGQDLVSITTWSASLSFLRRAPLPRGSPSSPHRTETWTPPCLFSLLSYRLGIYLPLLPRHPLLKIPIDHFNLLQKDVPRYHSVDFHSLSRRCRSHPCLYLIQCRLFCSAPICLFSWQLYVFYAREMSYLKCLSCNSAVPGCSPSLFSKIKF